MSNVEREEEKQPEWMRQQAVLYQALGKRLKWVETILVLLFLLDLLLLLHF